MDKNSPSSFHNWVSQSSPSYSPILGSHPSVHPQGATLGSHLRVPPQGSGSHFSGMSIFQVLNFTSAPLPIYFKVIFYAQKFLLDQMLFPLHINMRINLINNHFKISSLPKQNRFYYSLMLKTEITNSVTISSTVIYCKGLKFPQTNLSTAAR